MKKYLQNLNYQKVALYLLIAIAAATLGTVCYKTGQREQQKFIDYQVALYNADYEAEDYEQALINITAAISKEEHSIFLKQSALHYQNRAALEATLEDYPSALADLNKSIKLSHGKGTEGVYVIRGLVYESTGNTENALKDYATAYELDPLDGQLVLRYSRLLINENQSNTAYLVINSYFSNADYSDHENDSYLWLARAYAAYDTNHCLGAFSAAYYASNIATDDVVKDSATEILKNAKNINRCNNK